jgi:cytochrome c-type biogenesis protein CcmE
MVTPMQKRTKIICGVAAVALALVLAIIALALMSEAIPVSIDELSNNPSEYHLKRVTVSGTVSKLGELRGPYFYLDEKISVCYYREDGTFIDISKIKNGDYVTVTGKFRAPDEIRAESITKAHKPSP